MRNCRIGMVGAGGVAQRHARMLATLPDARLVAVTDPDRARAAALAAATGARTVAGVVEVLETGVDAVYVCVPPFAHGPVEELVVAAGVAMFVEKPLAADIAVADRVAGAVAAAGIVTSVGHHWRYSRAVRRARRLLRDRPARLAVGCWLGGVPPVAWWAIRARSGGQVVEQAVHVLDLARVLVGEVEQVFAMADPMPPRRTAPNLDGADGTDGDAADVDGATAAVLRFAGGAVGSVTATCRLGWKHRAGLEVYADGLAVSVEEDRFEARRGDTTVAERIDPDAARLAADRAFVAAVLGRDGEPLVDYADALRTHRLACAVATAAAAGPPPGEPALADRPAGGPAPGGPPTAGNAAAR